MSYNSSGLHTHTCQLGSLESFEHLLVLIVGVANFPLSIKHTGAYFLTIESDKCMRILTRLYSMANGIGTWTATSPNIGLGAA